MFRHWQCRTLAIACVHLIMAVAAAGSAPAAEPLPYSASYAVSYRGLNAGRLHFALRRIEPGLYVYQTRAEPTLLARLLIGSDALERSLVHIDERGVRPLSWFVEDGKSGSRNDGSLIFDWEAGRVHGTVKGEAVDLQTVPGLQDRLSIQIAVMTALLRGIEPGTIPMMSDEEIKFYSYRPVGEAAVRTPAGEFATILYESTRPGSSRLSRIWHAPALDYLAVRGEQLRDGKVETVMELTAVQRQGAARTAKERAARADGP